MPNGRNNKSLEEQHNGLDLVSSIVHPKHRTWTARKLSIYFRVFVDDRLSCLKQHFFYLSICQIHDCRSSSVDILSIIIQACFLLGLNLDDTFIEVLMVHLIIAPKESFSHIHNTLIIVVLLAFFVELQFESLNFLMLMSNRFMKKYLISL